LAAASLLRNPSHAGSLYSATNVANTLKITAISTKVDVTMIFCVFANDTVDEFVFPYDKVFGQHQNKNILYIRRSARTGCHTGTDQLSSVLGCFSSIDTGEHTVVVPWPS
jgi:hypothetical protein